LFHQLNTLFYQLGRPNNPSKPWLLLAFELLRVKDYDSCGTLNLPPYIDSYDAFAIFKLLFTDKILDKLIEWTNKYAELYLLRRILLPICKEESYTCFGVLIYMGITIESAIEDCWGTCEPDGAGLDRLSVYRNIILQSTDIIYLIFLSTPLDPIDPIG
jgi:hypothetical protein